VVSIICASNAAVVLNSILADAAMEAVLDIAVEIYSTFEALSAARFE
jgi:peroxiredoxin family protein